MAGRIVLAALKHVWAALEPTNCPHPTLWHGLLTVPRPPTAGLPVTPLETFGQAGWHGQETVPQQCGRRRR